MSEARSAAVVLPPEKLVETPSTRTESTPTYNVGLGYLRAFITVTVLAHHSVLAYHPFAPAPLASLVAQPRWWQAFPIVDSKRWIGFGLFVSFNDIFMMSLMFFISGLFVWKSLLRKGSANFLRDRSLRLGVPFVAAAALVAPLAYYPAYLQTGARPSLAGFWRQWIALGHWPAGPAWFVWLLLAFDCCAVALLVLIPGWGEALARLVGALRRPAAFFGILLAVSAAAYVLPVLIFGPSAWAAFGPFAFQTSRLLHYLFCFLVGAGVGAYGLDRGLLAPDGKLVRRWPVWLLAALAGFGLAVIVTILGPISGGAPRALEILGAFAFVVSCAASSFAFLAVFLRFSRRRVKAFDSLRDNAYGMYLIHYPCVTWVQYALLKAQFPAVAKASVVFCATCALSWAATAALRRVPGAARVI